MSSYSRFDREQLILRDELAMERTALANERTMLAYLRTALALLLGGITFIHFARATWFAVVGVICLVMGTVTLSLGLHRYQRMRKALSSLRRTGTGPDATDDRGE